jgi:hypothetical protein
MVCCTSQCPEATTSIDTSVGTVVTTTEEGIRESGMCNSLSECWAHALFLPWEVMGSGCGSCDKALRLKRRRGVCAIMREVGYGCGHHEHAMHANAGFISSYSVRAILSSTAVDWNDNDITL